MLVASIYWWRVFPVTLTEATGLTPFKKGAEYVLCALFVVAIVLLWRKSDRMPGQTWRLLRAALVVTIAAELWFTLYQSAHTWPNLVGHFLLVLSALLVFRAVVDDGLARPHALAVSNLREAEQMHRRLEQALVPSVPVRREGLEILTHYRPSEHHLALSGDFIDVLDRGRRRRGHHLRRRQRPRTRTPRPWARCCARAGRPSPTVGRTRRRSSGA